MTLFLQTFALYQTLNTFKTTSLSRVAIFAEKLSDGPKVIWMEQERMEITVISKFRAK